jgi:hypothetical protein
MTGSSDHIDRQLDQLLQGWATEQAVDRDRLSRLQRSICPAIVAAPANRNRREVRSMAAVWAVAAVVIVTLIVGLQTTDRSPPASTVTFAPREVRTHLARLWNESGKVFGSDLVWLGDLDGELLLGVGSETRPVAAADRVCLLLTMRVFDPVRQQWVESWSGQFACPEGTTIDFVSADKQSSGSIWVQPRHDGKFVVSHWLNWREHPELSGEIDSTVAPNAPQVVADVVEDGRRIQIVQQVWRPDLG